MKFFLLLSFLLLFSSTSKAITINFAIGAGVKEFNNEYDPTGSFELSFLWGKTSMMAGFGFIKNASYGDDISGFEAIDLMVKFRALTFGVFYGGKQDHFSFDDPFNTDDIYATSGIFIDYDIHFTKNISTAFQLIYETPSKGQKNILPSILLKYWWW